MFMDNFDEDPFAEQRATNLYYPLQARMNGNQLLKLRLDHQGATEPAGDAAQRVHHQEPVENVLSGSLGVSPFAPKQPSYPNSIHFTPFRLWANSEKLMGFKQSGCRVMLEHAESNYLPAQPFSTHSFHPIKPAMTGDRSAYPMLISLADIDMDFRMKASHHEFFLLSLLPITIFWEKDPTIRGVLASRPFHAIPDFILEPLKRTADPSRLHCRYSRDFGDPFRHQNHSFHDASKILPPETVNAWPPDGVWKCG
ncbi:hypothetical protein C8F04DRAFT_1177297 [Mycena alexandri]|uniref:Uncharacterized protein n=1 Tax=Mycena alexandri TaxID=1745969 RepID=A0AAD6T9E8_9AGAR|nr:hypothetical protein C8F04DRAFT_1177297 [Mycena alexandri]